VGTRAVLDAVVKRKIPSPHRESNPRTPIVQPVAQEFLTSARHGGGRSDRLIYGEQTPDVGWSLCDEEIMTCLGRRSNLGLETD
jgi:hypothetical protein